MLGRVSGLLRRARRLSWGDLWETGIALFLAVVIEVGLRTVRLPRLARMLGVPLQVGDSAVAGSAPITLPPWARNRLQGAARVLRRSPYDTCLRQSLIAGQRLRRLNPSLRLGVRRDGNEILAHAWIEIDGVSLDVSADDYKVLRSTTRS
jgi:hypothetical protein